MQMYQVDAFTDRVFAGNPAAVLILEDWLPDAQMLAIAQENNLAETAFVKARPDGAWDLRWFAPALEVDFCGHATLATAHVLFTTGKADTLLVFQTRVGELSVSRETNGYRLDIPRLSPEPIDALPHEIADIFVEPPVHIFRNFENFFADLGSAEAVRKFVPDLAAIALLGSVGLVVTGQEADGAKAHFFALFCSGGRNSGRPGDRFHPCYACALLGFAIAARQADRLSGVGARRMARLRIGRRPRYSARQRRDIYGSHDFPAGCYLAVARLLGSVSGRNRRLM